ncbi:glycoside hydrolase family 15 protein [Legionella waltersii]|nr:glycoside hydrolase family 15 protein [Legionella waltersii]
MTFWVSQSIAAVFTTNEVETLKKNFFANFQPNGAIVASPSQHDPNYYFDWVRDSAIAMGLIETWFEAEHSNKLMKHLLNYVAWTEDIQNKAPAFPEQDILGEPKFYISGMPFDGEWGRPQNDGPALRATVLIRFAHQLLNRNETNYVQKHLYNSTMDPQTMGIIKKDLEYVAHHWQDANFDLWEEVLGHHFYTAMAQKIALENGAILAHRLDDDQAAFFYLKQARGINDRLALHIDNKFNLIQATLTPHPGPQKTMELDSAVVLAVLLAPGQAGDYALQGVYVKNTIKALRKQFSSIFPINKNHSEAILFGRYPGDTYDGHSTNSVGNPWIILTATMAEYYYASASLALAEQQNSSVAESYLKKGDGYLMLIKNYASNLYLSEQINLHTGIQQGARSLTWSYVSVLRAIEMREKVASKL